MGNGVTHIGAYAFRNCTALTSITIPNSVQEIGACAFFGCTSLEEITIPFVGESRNSMSGTTQSLFGFIFYQTTSYTPMDGMYQAVQYYTTSKTISAAIPLTLTRVTVTDTVTIGFGAFSGCTSLVSVILPEGITSLDGTFYNCTSL